MSASDSPKGPFVLSGPSEKLDSSRWPVRGDLAHIALAGRLFVPHYAVPQARKVKKGGAPLRASPGDASDTVRTLEAGYPFDVLDIQGRWAWGICNGLDGPIGYVAVDRLEEPQ